MIWRILLCLPAGVVVRFWWFLKGRSDKVVRAPRPDGWHRGPIDPLLPPRRAIRPAKPAESGPSRTNGEVVGQVIRPLTLDGPVDWMAESWRSRSVQPTQEQLATEFWKETRRHERREVRRSVR